MVKKKKNPEVPMLSPLDGDMTMILAAARLIKDGEVVFSASKWAKLVFELATKTGAPNAILVEENGAITGQGIVAGSDTIDAAGEILQAGKVDVALVGAEQIDQFGNANGTLIGKYKKPWKRLAGWASLNDVLTFARRVIFIGKNRKDVFTACEFLTGPGYLKGRKARNKELLSGGPANIVTDMCVFGFDEKKKRAFIYELHPGITVDDVIKNTGWRPLIPKKLSIIDPPTPEERKALGV